MRETFSDYKKILEQNLINIEFLYSGDVISSSENYHSEIRNNDKNSPSFMINAIKDIYQKSFDIMINKSEEIILAKDNLNDESYSSSSVGGLFEKIIKIKPIVRYIFCSKKSKDILGVYTSISNDRSFPNYLYSIDKLVGNTSFEIFESPLIKEIGNESVLYTSTAPIQSIVYSIQNMEYTINRISNTSWEHKITYNLYDCDYDSKKIIIKDISDIREDKLKYLLK